MILQEGIYEIPDNCTVIYSKRKVIVKRKVQKEQKPVCRLCEHQKFGRKCMKNQWWDSYYCEISPKVIGGEEKYFYSACPSKRACEKFKNKTK